MNFEMYLFKRERGRNVSETFKEDPRLKNAFKEFLLMNGVLVAYTIVWFLAMLTWARNPYTLILGLPWWFAMSFIAILFNVVVAAATILGVKDDDLSGYAEGEQQ